MARIVIVDDTDTVIGAKEYWALEPGDVYRASALWLTNSRGDVLMAQRAFTKIKDPGVWGPAVAGTVDEGESYDDNIVKEIREEIGLEIPLSQLKRGPKIRIKNRPNECFGQWYLYTIDKNAEDFVLQKEEVIQVKWFAPAELLQAVRSRSEEFVYSLPQWIPHLLNPMVSPTKLYIHA
jgi:isopentenyldiphosphate isomerase